jgi:hypothetical protein
MVIDTPAATLARAAVLPVRAPAALSARLAGDACRWATKMPGYLKLNPAKDRVDVADIGDNIFLIRFARATNI